MRNLKKILALVLALMMVLSVMVTASAASPLEKFSDVETVNPDYLEAVTVMVAAGVLNGTDKGLEPTRVLTRAEAAVLITYLNTTAEGDEASYSAKCETYFDDVAATHWASGFITYCNDKGLMVGTDKGFEPGRNLTYIEYAAMLLRVLGIDTTATDGAKWDVPVKNGAANAKLLKGIETYTWTGELTREAACQMTFNALNYRATGEATGAYLIVPADTMSQTLKDMIAEINEDPFTSMADAVVYMTALQQTLGTDYSITPQRSASGTLMAAFDELVEPATATDEFGRPLANVWKNGDGDIIYFDEVTAKATWTSAMTDEAIEAALKGYKLGGKKMDEVYGGKIEGIDNTLNGNNYGYFGVRGETYTVAEKLATFTGNGNVVEIYVDEATKAITDIVRIDYTTAEVNVSRPDTNGTVTYTIGSDTYKDYTDAYIAAEAAKGNTYADTVVVNGNVAHEDHITYVVLGDKAYVYATETVEGILSRKTATGSYLTIGGEKIAVGVNALTGYGSYAIGSAAQKFVLDQYGYVVDLYTPGTGVVYSNDYAYVIAIQAQGFVAPSGADLINADSEGKDPLAKAVVVLADGSYAVVNLAVTATPTGTPGVYTYSYAKPVTDGTVVDGTLNGSSDNIALSAGDIGNWFAYTVTEDGDYVLEELGGVAARPAADINVTPKYLAGDVSTFGGVVTSNTKLTALSLNPYTNAVTVTDLAGLNEAVALDAEKVMYTVNALDGTVTSILFYDFAPTTYVAPDYVYVVAKGDQVSATNYEYSVFMGGELTTITVADGTLTKGALLTVADIDAYGVYTLTPAGSLSSEVLVTVADKSFFMAGSTQYVYDRYAEVYNITTGATGAADVVEVGDYVVVYNADSDSDIDLVYIVDKPEV